MAMLNTWSPVSRSLTCTYRLPHQDPLQCFHQYKTSEKQLTPCAEGVAGLQRYILETCWAMTRRPSPAT